MEQSSGFSSETKFIAVHWRKATWAEIAALGSVDPFYPPRRWNLDRHPWVLFEPADPKVKYGWAYSRTSDPKFPDELSDVRICHEKHEHTPKCSLLDQFGVMQIAAEERIPVFIDDFINLRKVNSRCDLESNDVVKRVSQALKKAHPGSWIKPKFD